jgi:hypothetical protein
MNDKSNWYPFGNGQSIGQIGSEGGIILRDEEHADGARITLEREGRSSPFAITCGIYGWMVHTRFFSSEAASQQDFEEMKSDLERILNLIPMKDEMSDEKINEMAKALSDFVDCFP